MARSSFYNTNPPATDLVLGADLLVSVTALKVAAEASATLAGTYAASALSSLNLIYESANTAIDAAHLASDNAAASAALAVLKADEAAASASDAADGVALIGGYASAASASANAASVSATASENSKIASTAAAFAANADASAAALSADDAYDHEQDALAHKNAASTSATAASTSEGNALTYRNNASTSATNASNSAADALAYRNTASGHASDALTRANNALASANNSANSATDALTYRGQTLTYRNEAEGFKNAAANSAAAAATFDPALFMPKAGGTFTGPLNISGTAATSREILFQTSGSNRWRLATAPQTESGGNVGSPLRITSYSDAGTAIANVLVIERATGQTTLSTRPAWQGFTPWDNGNLPFPAIGMKSPTALANNATISSSNSGQSFSMDLAAGVQVINLPTVASVYDGWSCVVFTSGSPSGYQTARVSAETGKNVSFSGIDAQHFYLAGRGEAFRFTWLPTLGSGVWLAELIKQPQPFRINRWYAGAGAWNSGSTTQTGIFFNNRAGDFAMFNISGGATTGLPVTGMYRHLYRYQASASAGGGVTGAAAMYGSLDAGTADSGAYSRYDVLTVGEDTKFMIADWTRRSGQGSLSAAYYYMSSTAIWFYPDNNFGTIDFIGR